MKGGFKVETDSLIIDEIMAGLKDFNNFKDH